MYSFTTSFYKRISFNLSPFGSCQFSNTLFYIHYSLLMENKMVLQRCTFVVFILEGDNVPLMQGSFIKKEKINKFQLNCYLTYSYWLLKDI